ncbi:MAG: HAMP domain-containing histidine kinase [Myxococcales bacterium]|nr:HAMP domain-containing histidine kinase [Myxococcales bacterium]
MRLHLAAPLAVLVLAPLAALAWLGVRLAADRDAEVAARLDAVVQARLNQVADDIAARIGSLERRLLDVTADFPVDPDLIRQQARGDVRFAFALVFAPDGRLAFPPPDGPLSDRERAFLERTRGLWDGRDLPRQLAGRKDDGNAPRADHGWHIWYWGGGLNLLFWRRQADGRLAAIEVDRVRLLAEVIGALPATADTADERIALLDSSGAVAYQWGAFEPSPGVAPRLSRALAPPLQAWQLTWSGPAPVISGLPFELITALCAVALALIGLAFYFYRASTAELRRAAQRVSFVNQVSHELKTPLTNIRMYAELLEDELFDADPKAQRHLGVIVDESRRLSRLIANILTFARQQRDKLAIRPAPGVVDQLVSAVVEQFGLALAARGIEVKFEGAAKASVKVDADALGQILGNLLSNVEKYAAGTQVHIRTRQADGFTEIEVADQGPGIPPAQRARVFEPFHRLGGALTEGVTGTGIGLGIARALARLHGGDLTLERSDTGARFVARLRTELETP